jgi:hypothetical protein
MEGRRWRRREMHVGPNCEVHVRLIWKAQNNGGGAGRLRESPTGSAETKIDKKRIPGRYGLLEISVGTSAGKGESYRYACVVCGGIVSVKDVIVVVVVVVVAVVNKVMVGGGSEWCKVVGGGG